MDEAKNRAGISSFSLCELEDLLAGRNEPRYRARQLFEWLHKKRAASFDEMTDLPKSLRGPLAQAYSIEMPTVQTRQTARDGTEKLLLAYGDGALVETVLMRHRHGNSLCVSSQVGCRMGCRFCASGKLGLARNLSAGEMAGELYAAGKSSPDRISHIVLMGIGEPLDNFDEVMRFLQLVTCEAGQGLSMRNITLSTCGHVPGIRRLARQRLSLTLSISLHSPFDEVRSSMMPVNDRWPLAELLDACKEYTQTTKRRLSLEYALVSGINDRPEDAKALAGMARSLGAHVNLITVNPIGEGVYTGTTPEKMEAFQAQLQKFGANVTVRRRLGVEITAACGQLRAGGSDPAQG